MKFKYNKKGYVRVLGLPMRKEKKTVRVRNRRFNPGLVLRMVLGSKSDASSDIVLGGSEEEVSASEISAMVESLVAPSTGITSQCKYGEEEKWF